MMHSGGRGILLGHVWADQLEPFLQANGILLFELQMVQRMSENPSMPFKWDVLRAEVL